MANCKVCNTPIPDGTDICDDCNRRLVQNDELYLDQLLASVTGSMSSDDNQPYQDSQSIEGPDYQDDNVEDAMNGLQDLQIQSSNDDDWDLLNRTINKQLEEDSDYSEYDKGIPAEGALDEVDSILDENYNSVLQEIANGPDEDSDTQPIEFLQDPDNLIDTLVQDGMIDNQDDMMSIPDDLIEEDMQNPLVDQDVIYSLDDEIADLYQNDDSGNHDIPLASTIEDDATIDKEDDLALDDEYLSSLLASDIADEPNAGNNDVKNDTSELMASLGMNFTETSPEEPISEESIIDESINEEPVIEEPVIAEPVIEEPVIEEPVVEEPVVEEPVIEDLTLEEQLGLNDSAMETPIEEPIAIEPINEEEPMIQVIDDGSDNAFGLSDELSELDKLLGEVTQHVDDYNIDNIMHTGVLDEEDASKKQVDASDVLSKSLSAVSDMDDPLLEAQFNSILPTETPQEEKKKVGFFKKIFGNIPPENPEEEAKQFKQEEILAEERKKQKEEDKQKKQALKEENKAKKAAAKEAKQKSAAEQKEKQRKARDAIAAAYVPEGKINKAGAFVVFVMAAVVAFVIIYGTTYASYQLSIKSAEKDYKNSRYDEAYETLSGESIKEEDEVIYDKLQTIMVVKKQLNSYYNYKKLGMELEALNSVIKGIDRYQRYYENAKELKVDEELNSLKGEMLKILKDNYDLSEEDAVKLIGIDDGQTYTERLTTIVNANIIPEDENPKQIARKN